MWNDLRRYLSMPKLMLLLAYTTSALLLTPAHTAAAPTKEKTQMKYEWLSTARFISWHVDKFWALDEARQEAKRLKATGANTVITFGYHYRFDHVDEWPQIKESLKNIVTACHEQGLRVIEHHSATFVPPDSLKHTVDGIPLTDCTVIDARDGKPAYFEQYKIIMLCCNNPKFRKVYFNYVLDLAKETGIDGLMSDDIEFCPTWYVCGCKYCREKFGAELPAGDSPRWGDYSDEWFRNWLRFRMRSVGDYYVDLRKAMTDKELDIPLLGCLAGASSVLLSQNWGMTGEEFARGVDLNFYEAYFGCSNFYSWRNQGPEISYYLGIGRRRAQPLFTLDYTRSQDDIFFMWAFNLLMGDRMWINAIPRNPGEAFDWESAHEELFKSPRTVSNIALLFSRQTRDVYGGNSSEFFVNEWLGWGQMLMDASIPYETIVDADLTGDLSRYRLLILPNTACLSDAQIAGIRRFMEKGGSVIATHDTACFDETGARRKESALADWIAHPPARFFYHEDKPGTTQVFPLPSFRNDAVEAEWKDTRDPKVRSKLLAEVRHCADPLPWRLVEGSPDVIANVHSVKGPKGDMLVAHVLNVAPLYPGKTAVIKKDEPAVYAPQSLSGPVTLEFRIPKPSSAVLYSPDNVEPIKLAVTEAGEVWRVRIEKDQLRRYGAIKIETK